MLRLLSVIALGCFASAFAGTPPDAPLPYPDTAHAPGAGVFNTLWKGFPQTWAARQKAFAADAPRSRGAIVFLGDSITEICPLKKLFPNLRVANRGISGDTTRGMLCRLDHDVIALEPKAVVLLGGTNDIRQEGYDVTDTAANTVAIVKTLRAKFPALPLVVLKVMPSVERTEQDVNALNARVADGLKDVPKCVIVDTHTPFLKDGAIDKSLFYDGTHPSAAGYEVYRKTLAPVLAKLD